VKQQRRKTVGLLLGGGLLLAFAVLGVAVGGREARAGRTASSPVGFSNPPSPNGAWGAMGSARVSPDAFMFVRCEVMASDPNPPGIPGPPGPMNIRCTFADSTGVQKMCVSTNESLIWAVMAVGDSRVSVQIKDGSSECASISVMNTSEFPF